LPSRLRPIAVPHLEQVRLSSGTCGLGLIAFAASTGGAGGTRVRPAPRRAARIRCDPVRVRRVANVAWLARAEPNAVDCTLLAEVATETSPASGSAPVLDAAGAESAAEPQTSQ
jgi:hypothetical protein